MKYEEGSRLALSSSGSQFTVGGLRGLRSCVPTHEDLFLSLGLTYNQMNANLVSQATTMSTHGVPNDVLGNLNPITLIILIPVCDLFVSDKFASGP